MPFNCGRSKGRAKLFPKKDTFKMVMAWPKQFWIPWITQSQDGPWALTRHWDRGSRQRLHEFAWAGDVAWCLKGDLFLFLNLNSKKPAQLFLCCPWKDWKDTGGLQYNMIPLLGRSGTRNWLFGGAASTSHFSAPYPENGIMQVGNWNTCKVTECFRDECSVGTAQDNPRGAGHGTGLVSANTQPCWEWTGSLAGSSGITYWLLGFYWDILKTQLGLCWCGPCLPLTLL